MIASPGSLVLIATRARLSPQMRVGCDHPTTESPSCASRGGESMLLMLEGSELSAYLHHMEAVHGVVGMGL